MFLIGIYREILIPHLGVASVACRVAAPDDSTPRDFADIAQVLACIARALEAVSDTRVRRELLREMRKLLSEADRLA